MPITSEDRFGIGTAGSSEAQRIGVKVRCLKASGRRSCASRGRPTAFLGEFESERVTKLQERYSLHRLFDERVSNLSYYWFSFQANPYLASKLAGYVGIVDSLPDDLALGVSVSAEK